MTILTHQQIEALRDLRREVDGTSVAVHELPHPHRAYVVIWRDDETEPVWRGTISPAGVVRGDLLVAA